MVSLANQSDQALIKKHLSQSQWCRSLVGQNPEVFQSWTLVTNAFDDLAQHFKRALSTMREAHAIIHVLTVDYSYFHLKISLSWCHHVKQ